MPAFSACVVSNAFCQREIAVTHVSRILAALVLTLAASGLAAQTQPPAPVQAATSVVQQQLDAYNKKDIEAFLGTYAGDVKIYEHPDKMLMDGIAAVRERYSKIFADAALHARLANRMAMGNQVIDHEFVTRTFPTGVGIKQWIAIYDVQDGRIPRVTLIPGPVEMSVKN